MVTVIVGYTDKDSWAIAADSGVFEGGDSDGDEGTGIYWKSDTPKIWVKENSLIGASGLSGMCNLAQQCPSGDPYQIAAFMRKDETSAGKSWNILVITKEAAFYLSDDYSVERFRRGYMAIGAASGVGLGALAACQAIGMEPKAAVRLAVGVSIEHHIYAVGPISVKVMEGAE